MVFSTRKGEGRGYDLEKIFEVIGWENVLDAAIKKWGVEMFVESIGAEKFIERFVERLSPAQKAKLKRRLQRGDRAPKTGE